MPENAAQPPGPSGEGAPKPSLIGGFELLATLGKGGMGTVFKARQVSMDRVVALKVLPPNLAQNQAFVERFLREARSAAKLNHPNIVQGIDVGEADGVYYFAMEFVDGTTLKDILKREGRLDEKKALNIVGGVARALEHAHKHGIVHRDIKPDNMMISRDGVVKLADLGLARSVLPRASDPQDAAYRDTVTLDGTALGTPHYMAPEQARGEADLDTRADIYALGATLFHTVTGQFPYSAPNAGALMAKHITEPVPNPKDRNPALSRPICDLIERMMAKDRADRPQTPTDLLSEIRDALEGKIHLHRPAQHRPQPSQRTGRPPAPSVHPVHIVHSPPRRTALPWAIAAGLLLAAGALFLLLRPGKTAEPQAKEDRTAKDAKIAKMEGPKTSQPAAKPVREPAVEHELAALKSQCDDLMAKDHFGPALAAVDAFAKSHPASKDADVTSGLAVAIQAKADERFAALALAADAAIEKRDFPAARAALKPAESFGIPDLADRAKKKLTEIASREKSAEAWAKWDALKADVKKQIDAAKFDEAAQLLDGAKALPLDGIADLVAEQMKSIESTKSALLKAALAAYQAESDKVWAFFKQRDYAAADKLLAGLAANPKYVPIVGRPSGAATLDVRPAGPDRTIRVGDAGHTAADHLQADQEAAKLLKEFWAAVEKGLASKAGQFVSFRGAAGGSLVAVQDGTATVKTPQGKTEPRRVQDLVAGQAVIHAGLKGDAHSSLVTGVFLLAEGEELEKTGKAFATAGDEARVALFKQRLALLLAEKPARLVEPTPEVKPAATGKWQVYKVWPFDAVEAVRRQEATAHALGVEVEEEVDLGNGVTMAFALIPAGEFLMGSPPTTSPEKLAAAFGGEPGIYEREFPQHRVRITRPFWIGKHEVTQQVWEAVMGDNPSENKGKPLNPVERVTWVDSQEFLKKLDARSGKAFRLPTEAEWEYACRAGTTTEFCFGDSLADLGSYGWFNANCNGSTHPVGQAKPNAWGIHDMHGNVWEWCQDLLGPYAKGAQTDPTGPEGGIDRCLRGGSWNRDPRTLRSAYRGSMIPAEPWHHIGLRLALALELRHPKAAVEDLKAGKWQSLFDGKTLDGWKIVEEGPFAQHGKAGLKDGQVTLEPQGRQTGISWTGRFPTEGYEATFEVSRVAGNGCLCVAAFPVGTAKCALTLGGYGGSVVGLGLVDGKGSNQNVTTTRATFENGRWYRVGLRVTRARIEVWLDEERVISVERAGHVFENSGQWALLNPFGVGTLECPSALRRIRVRRLGE